MKGAKRVTAKDVAAASGVSQSTVSYVLNNVQRDRIPEATRERVLAAAASLGYVPNESARALRLGRSNVVLLVIADVKIGRGIDSLVSALAEQLGRKGMTLVLHRRADGEDLQAISRAIAPRLVLSLGEMAEDEIRSIQALGANVGIMRLGAPSNATDGEYTGFQDVFGAMQVEYLAGKGHRKIGYAWPADSRVDDFARPRFAGAAARAAELGLSAPLTCTVDYELDSASAAIESWLSQGVTAVAAFNDDIAFAILGAAARLGVAVPDQLAVIGLDAEPGGAVTFPPLTSIEIDTRQLAHEFARQIAARDADDRAGSLYVQREPLRAEYVERSSA